MNKSEALKSLTELTAFVTSIPDPVTSSKFKLTLPVNKDGALSGKSDAFEITPDKLPGYKDQWYYEDKNGTNFICPGQDEHPAKTGNSDYGRTEYLDERRFDGNHAYDSDVLKYVIVAIGPKGKLVFLQIHRGNKAITSMAPVVKYVVDATGLIRALVKKTNDAADTVVTFTDKIKLNEPFIARVEYKPKGNNHGDLYMTINNETKILDVDLTGADASYGKMGCYNNSAVGRGHVVILK